MVMNTNNRELSNEKRSPSGYFTKIECIRYKYTYQMQVIHSFPREPYTSKTLIPENNSIDFRFYNFMI